MNRVRYIRQFDKSNDHDFSVLIADDDGDLNRIDRSTPMYDASIYDNIEEHDETFEDEINDFILELIYD